MNRSGHVLLIVGLAGLAAFLGAELAARLNVFHEGRSIQTPTGATSSAPAPLDSGDSPTPGIQSVAKIPARLPAFSLHDLQGATVSIDRWRGKSLMLNFWATWCEPCRREIPLLQAIHLAESDSSKAAQAGDGTEVIGIAVDAPDKVRQFAQTFGITYPLLVGEQDALDVAAHLGVATPAFPFTVFADRRGAVVALYLGALKRPDVDQILHIVHRLDHDQLDLPTAQQQIGALLASEREQ